MRIKYLFSLVIALAFLACQQSTSTDDQLEVNQFVSEQAAFGYQINDLASTSDEIATLTSDPMDTDVSVPGTASARQLKDRAVKLQKQFTESNVISGGLLKMAGDTSFVISDTNGVKMLFNYSEQTGFGRYIVVTYEFPQSSKLVYDSSEIVIDMKYTLWNPEDDLLKGFYQFQQFRDTYFINTIESQVDITAWDGTEPVGISATVTSEFKEERALQRKVSTITLSANNSGTMREDFYFKDGTSSYASFTINADHTGTFEKKLRNGTMVSGTFDQLEDDNHGSYTSLIDFAQDFYLDKIMKSAEVWLENLGQQVRANYSELIVFADGRMDSTSSEVTVTDEWGVTTTTMVVNKANGAYGTVTFTEDEYETTVEAEWTTWDKYYIIANAEYYADGSGHIHYEVWLNEAAHADGADPLVVADYTFSSPESGDGTLAYNGQVYQLQFDGSGKATISLGGVSKSINLYF